MGGWVVNVTTRPLYSRERHGTHCIGGWVAPGPVWTGAKNLAPNGIRSPDCPARSESPYRMSYGAEEDPVRNIYGPIKNQILTAM
jgi:hypothetical protein